MQLLGTHKTQVLPKKVEPGLEQGAGCEFSGGLQAKLAGKLAGGRAPEIIGFDAKGFAGLFQRKERCRVLDEGVKPETVHLDDAWASVDVGSLVIEHGAGLQFEKAIAA